jgi:hypothetical protein
MVLSSGNLAFPSRSLQYHRSVPTYTRDALVTLDDGIDVARAVARTGEGVVAGVPHASLAEDDHIHGKLLHSPGL